jgi:putative ABC transport system permease protein
VVADVMPQDPKWNGPGGAYSSAFFPTRINGMFDQLVIRSAKADRSRVLRDALDRLEKLEPDAVIEGKLYTDIRQHYYADITNTGWMLLLVCVVMLAVTAFGIIGLTSFWVSQRRKQIGVRRAIGARRDQILRYFQTENFLLSAAGVGLGAILTFAINLYLIAHYQAQRMPWYYLPSSALALWALGQLAVLGPALRAASVPPVEATRTV